MMEYINRIGYDFSRLTLGTVQLGIDYGISNANGKPSQDIAKNIIDSALKAGITTLDTSETYGSAEKIIGDYLATHKGLSNPVIATKFKITLQSSYTIESVRTEIYKSLNSSLRQLNLAKIPVYLFHKDKEQHLGDVIEHLLKVFTELKAKGLIDIAGISAYGPEDVDTVLKYDILEAVQIPINIFDQRLVNDGRLDQLKAQTKIVFARSIYLQGLFFIKAGEIPVKLHEAKPYLNKLEEIAKAARLSIPQLAFAYINSMHSITSIVFGAVSTEQVNENVALLETSPLNSDIQELISQSFSNVPEFIITPGLW
jgi:aryl-alcohol dehydrogenase-like predicted oxidoreductase